MPCPQTLNFRHWNIEVLYLLTVILCLVDRLISDVKCTGVLMHSGPDAIDHEHNNLIFSEPQVREGRARNAGVKLVVILQSCIKSPTLGAQKRTVYLLVGNIALIMELMRPVKTDFSAV